MSKITNTAMLIFSEDVQFQFLGMIDYHKFLKNKLPERCLETNNSEDLKKYNKLDFELEEDLQLFLSREVIILKTLARCYYREEDKSYENYEDYEDFSRFQRINRSPFGRFKHIDRDSKDLQNDSCQIEEGMLGRDLAGCSARNADLFSRGVLCELDIGVIGVINIPAHYSNNVFNKEDCVSIRDDLLKLWTTTPDSHKDLVDSTNKVLFMLYDFFEPEPDKLYINKSNIKEFNKLSKKIIFPIDLTGLHDEFISASNSIIDNQKNLDNKENSTLSAQNIGDAKARIKKSKEKLDEILDKQLYKTMTNLLCLNQYVANRYQTEDQLEQISFSTNNIFISYRKLLISFFKSEKCFNEPKTVVRKALMACTEALDKSLRLDINNEQISSYMKDFAKNMKDDIDDIQDNKDKNLLKVNNMNFTKTVSFIRQFQIDDLNISQSMYNTQTKLMDQLEKRNRGR